ncbi:hypothetical protein TRIUR3_07857 [Triticum urartu]|uniref:Uncharacterized protein n=1 Tax=Triticum urartu TaxID=4572 RepID=M8A0I3_TRIUA|nr:hypothetical protein TRIUR3_07857 [Triticum urartu]
MTNNGDRPRLNLNPPKRDPSATPVPAAEVARSRPSPFGAAKPREEVLAEKGLDWRKMEGEIEKKTSRPTSSHSSRPNSAHSSRPGSPGSQVSAVGSEGAPRARPKVNPFGDAKPREVVLQEKGKDWRKIDLELEHRAVNRPESEEEKNLKEEINLLKVDLKEIEAIAGDGSEQAKEVSEKISQMEKQLDLLTVELDDKIRFGQRPSSGAGRAAAFPSASEEPHVAVAHMDRPRSRGGVETYPKPVEERQIELRYPLLLDHYYVCCLFVSENKYYSIHHGHQQGRDGEEEFEESTVKETSDRCRFGGFESGKE